MDLDLSHPSLADLRRRARQRLPHFVWEYLDSATGTEAARRRSEEALDALCFMPAILRGEVEFDLSTSLLGQTYARPFGIGPVGMSGLIWPGAETTLARLGAELSIPYCLSTVASQAPETVGPHCGSQGWFQLYPARDPEIRRDILRRAREAGFGTLVMTADVPVASRRERQRRARMSIPPRVNIRHLLQAAAHPAWTLGTLRHGRPRLRLMESYQHVLEGLAGRTLPSTAHIGYLMRTVPDWDYLAALREEWPGHLVVKGVLDPRDAARLRTAGVDAVWVSNHGGRQFDAAPAALPALAEIRKALGPDYPLIYDSGVRSGVDVLRALAVGADFVMMGRAFHYGLAAFGAKGAAHAAHIISEEMLSAMGQMGIARPAQARDQLIDPQAKPPQYCTAANRVANSEGSQ